MAKNTELGKAQKKSPVPTGGVGNPSLNGAGRTPIDGASIDDLSKRLGEIEGVNQDMAMFLAHNWQRFVGGVFVVMLIAVLVNQYRNTQETRMADAAQRFELASTEFGKLLSAQAAEKEAKAPDAAKPPADPAHPDKAADAKPAAANDSVLFEQLKLLQSTQSDSIYGRLAGLYAAQARISERNFDAARAELAKLDTKKFASISQAKTSAQVKNNDLVDELAALQSARLAIEEGKAAPDELQRQLTGLVLGGRFTNLEALLILFRASGTPEQRAAASNAAKSLFQARPELRDIVTSQLASAGISIED
ncbi:MAG: hypothetical protein U0136_03120 [Bdellovibrionota bacterium]